MATTARSQSTDFFYSNRFALVIESGPFKSQKVASFQSITMPEHSIENIEYSEGIFSYSRFYPGRSSFSTISCHKGVIKGDTNLAKWIRRVSEGWNYRANMSIYQFHRSDVAGKISYSDSKAYRKIRMVNCMPIRYKPGSDFDAMSIDISISEIEFSMERFYIEEDSKEVKP